MSIKKELIQQFKKILPLVIRVWSIYIILFSLIIGSGKLFFNISADLFTRDPNQIVNIPFYVGAISNLGIIFWSGAATLCFFSFAMLTRFKRESPFRLFMLHSAMLTTILMLDDLYMWHEEMFPKYLKIPEFFVYGAYAIYLIYFLIRFKNVILKSRYLILLAALIFMGSSVLMDVMVDLKIFASLWPAFNKHETLFEDFLKSIGILTWLIYFSHVSFSVVLPQVKESPI